MRSMVAALAVLALPACNTARFVADKSPPMLDDQSRAFYRETSLRHAREAAPAMLKMLDGFIVSSPDNPELLTRGAQQYCGFALILIEDEDPEWATVLYRRGYEYAIRALRPRVEGFDALVNGPADALETALRRLDHSDTAPVFWAAACLAGFIAVNLDDPGAMAEIPRMLAFARAAESLDDTYFYAGPHLLLGTYYGSVGEALGGNPSESRRHFDRLFEVTGGKFLLGKVFYAKSTVVQQQNRDLFVRTLEEVRDAPANLDPDLALPNQAARRKALGLLERVDELFP